MRLINLLLLLFVVQTGFAQKAINNWTEVFNRNADAFEYEDRMTYPKTYRVFDFDLDSFKEITQEAPLEFSGQKSKVIISLPIMPSGYEQFEVYESPVMSPELAAKFPKIKSFKARGINHRSMSARIDYSPEGFYAAISTLDGRIFIDPEEMTSQHICYRTKDLEMNSEIKPLPCGYTPSLDASLAEKTDDLSTISSYHSSGAVLPLRVYRLALACTGEYAQAKGGTLNSVMASFVTAINRVNQIFELEAAVKVVMIDNTDDLIFLDGATDPYTNPTLGTGLLGQNVGAFNGQGVTVDQYDLGHVFTMGCSDVGGVVSGRTCDDGGKMRGVTCHYSSSIETIVVDVMSHEVGHQFTCGHSWNNCPSSIEQLSSENAFEPGSGSTIMSYAGSCGDQNIQFNSNEYYNIGSVEDFIFYSREGQGACGVEQPTSNNEPIVEIGLENGFFIPISTPFELEAVATDPDGDEITYCWEQYDLGPVRPIGSPAFNSPLFRSFPPRTNPKRIFPRIQNIISNNNDPTEVLPNYARDLTFRCTVRDNNPEAGATVWDEVRFESTESAGPFRVSYPSGVNIDLTTGDYIEVEWDVANTTNNSVNCQNVNIYLSINGGNTFPITLLENTPNDGKEFVLIPNELTTTARIKVKAADNIFFDISNSNFKILEATVPGYALNTSPGIQQICLPNEASVALETFSLLDYDSLINFEVIDGLPMGAVPSFTTNPASPAEGSMLNIDMNNVTQEGTYDVTVQAIAPSTDTLFRTFTLNVVSNDFSTLAINTPADGEVGVSTLPAFSWTPSDAAISYSIEIATSPTFEASTIVDTANDILENSYSPAVTFDESTGYYWRIFPENECGKGDAISTSSFNTVAFTCSQDESADTPINISGSGAPTVESKISVLADGIINDINIPMMRGNHEWFSDLRAKLISPAGTEVVLFDGKCLNYNGNYSLSIDDEAPLAFQCPPNGTFKPQQALSAFIGENTAGLWTIQIEDKVGGNGGRLEEWRLEFCASVNTTPPVLITNEAMPVNPGQGRNLSNDFLLVEDPNNEEWELIYTLVDIPQKGILSLEGTALAVGDEFSQSDIHWARLRYTHSGTGDDTDFFRFSVRDNEGGWLGTLQFDLLMDSNIMVDTEELLDDHNISLFPNPTSSIVQIQFNNLDATSTEISLVDVKGSILSQKTHSLENNLVELNVSHLPAGIYFLKMRLNDKVAYKKLIVE